MDAGPRQLCTGQLTGRPWRKVRVGEGVNEQEAPSVPAAFGAFALGVCSTGRLLVNDAGDVHILVSTDGSRYRVFARDEWRKFSAVDSDNTH